MNEPLSIWEALGKWSIEICRPDAELAPPQYLIDAIKALESAPKAEPVADVNPLIAALRDLHSRLVVSRCAKVADKRACEAAKKLWEIYAAAPTLVASLQPK